MWSRFVLKVMGIQVVASADQINEERENEKGPREKRGRVIVANHLSYLDIPVLLSLGPRLFLAKEEVASWPLMGMVGQGLGMVFFNRSSLRGRAKALEKVRSKLQEGETVVVFPEGTTSETGPLKGRVSYYPGAFRAAFDADVPVEFVYLDYSPAESCAWIGDQDFLTHLWRFLSVPRSRVALRTHWVEHLPNRSVQREVFRQGRNWFLEGGHLICGELPNASRPIDILG